MRADGCDVIRQHTSAYLRSYVSIRQHMSAYLVERRKERVVRADGCEVPLRQLLFRYFAEPLEGRFASAFVLVY